VVFNDFLQVVHPFEPHHFQLSASIAHLRYQAFFGPLAYHFPPAQNSLHLHKRQVIVQVYNVIKLSTVEVTEWVTLNQVAIGKQSQFFTQQLRPL